MIYFHQINIKILNVLPANSKLDIVDFIFLILTEFRHSRIILLYFKMMFIDLLLLFYFLFLYSCRCCFSTIRVTIQVKHNIVYGPK